jgi:hypothetical protein
LIHRREALLGLVSAAFAAATRQSAARSSAYRSPGDVFAALRDQKNVRLSIGAAVLRVVFADGAPGLDQNVAIGWVREAAEAVTAYFGRFPVPHYGLLIVTSPGEKIVTGTTWGFAGSFSRVEVGAGVTREACARDWVLVHEMTHTALPNLPPRALWLQEGNATYVEPIARAMIGNIPASEAWREALLGMPQGQPAAEDGGMDGTTDWGRLYWGGATFWLMAEDAIYSQTNGHRTLRDALRRINRRSGGNTVVWTPEKMVAVGDDGTGVNALQTLYRDFAAHRVAPDLPALFRRFGVAAAPGGGVVFDDGAPLAALRRRITVSHA